MKFEEFWHYFSLLGKIDHIFREQKRKWHMATGLHHPNKFEALQFLWQAMDGPERKPDEEDYISFEDLKQHFKVFNRTEA